MARYSEDAFSDDRRPMLSGLDTCDLSNICRNWFKHEWLFTVWLENESNRAVDARDLSQPLPDPEAIGRRAVRRFIACAEKEIRQELFDYAESYERSVGLNNAYIDGLLDGLGHKTKAIDE